ncbi:type II toxin-antitoxin system VapC family toxin [Allomeiothermus silvanus]|uniref:type II toxin-antitoxin system VapC family toxin n=1 Tax=Allomeiothermus silvanus TaxID=52022 RepID=UPI00019E8618
MLGEFPADDSRSKEARKRKAQREALLAGIEHLPFDAKTAELAAKAQARLKPQNQSLELRDLFIAACASRSAVPQKTTRSLWVLVRCPSRLYGRAYSIR